MKRLVLIPLVLMLVSGVAMAQSLTPAQGSGGRAMASGFVPGPNSITQNLDTSTITQFNSVSCNAGGLHTDNSYFRRFVLGDFGIVGQFDVTSIDTAVEQAFGAGGSQPVSVNLYSIAIGDAFILGNLTAIGSSDTTVTDGALFIVNFPVVGSVDPATDDLVVEFFTPDGQTAGNSLFVGSNPNGQTDPAYIAAADCGIVEPLPTGDLGFPDMHWILIVNGDEGGDQCTLKFRPFQIDRTASSLRIGYSMIIEHNRGSVQKSAFIELQDMNGRVIASKRAGILELTQGERVRVKGNLNAPADLAPGDYVFVLRLDGMKGFRDQRSPITIP